MNVSIIIPYSGKEHHIKRCIESIILQLSDLDEIIVVNDSINGVPELLVED